MTGYVKMFTSLDEDVGDYEHVTFGDNSKGKVVGLGKVAIMCCLLSRLVSICYLLLNFVI